ncbi:MAG: tetratricopeptide repeat protein [Bacteroidales bacterium]
MPFSKVFIRWFVCFFVFFFPLFLQAQTLEFDLRTKKVKQQDSLSLQIRTYETIIDEMQRQPSSYESLASIMTQLGDLYSANEDYPKAIYLYMRSIIIRQMGLASGNQNKSSVAWQVIEVGNSFYRLHDYQLAENAYRIAAQYFSKTSDKLGLITSLNNIGLCRLNLNKPGAALPLFRKTLAFSRQINDVPRIFSSSIYISISLKELHRFDDAIAVLNSLTDYELDRDHLHLEDYRKLQMGETYILFGDTLKGIQIYEQLIEEAHDESAIYYKAITLSRLGVFYDEMGDKQKAMEYTARSYELLKDRHHLTLLTSVNQLLYRLYKSSGDISKALFHFEAYHEGIMQLNNREIENFVNEYNKKMERITISQELKTMRVNSDRILLEKSNQQSLSVFLVIIAFLLLVMLYTAKGFDARVQMLVDHVRSYSRQEKLYLLLLLGVYFVAFYYFFVPVENAARLHNLSSFQRVLPGLIAYGVTFLLVLVFYSPFSFQKKVKNWYVYSLYFFSFAFFSVLFFEFIHFNIRGFGGFNFLISLSLIVLASFIVPLYLFILIVEKLIIRHVESISELLNQHIGQMKLNPGPDKKMVTLQSEKTSGRLTFEISELMSVEAQGNYSMFVLLQNNLVNRKILHITMKAIEESLAEYEFIVRCHKSYMINIQHIEKVTGNSRGYLVHFNVDADPVPVSRNFQKNVMEVIRKFKDGF